MKSLPTSLSLSLSLSLLSLSLSSFTSLALGFLVCFQDLGKVGKLNPISRCIRSIIIQFRSLVRSEKWTSMDRPTLTKHSTGHNSGNSAV